MSKKTTDIQKGSIFKELASKTMYDVGLKYEFDKHYASPKAVKNAIRYIYAQVRDNPDRFGIQDETVELVVSAMTERRVTPVRAPSMVEQESIKNADIKGLILTGRDRSARLVNKKLEYLELHPKLLKQESIVALGKIMGILFDKGQIIQGQATEHVALMGRIDKDMSPEDAMNMVLKMREVNQSE